jgi:branched-subunit amino acid aminotransferase/4-amino-4-deoxychorismate lyase
LHGVRVTERQVGSTEPVRLVTSHVVHRDYRHKTTEREQFDRVLEEARAAGADDGLMLTDSGHLAECAIWSLFWWDGDVLCAPAGSLGVLPGVARRRIGELQPIEERRSSRRELDGLSLFVANAVRGIVPVPMLDGRAVAPHAGTAGLMERFWP